MAWNIDNVATHCFYCGEPLDVGGLHAMEAVNFHGKFVCRVFSHSDCYNSELLSNSEQEKFGFIRKLKMNTELRKQHFCSIHQG